MFEILKSVHARKQGAENQTQNFSYLRLLLKIPEMRCLITLVVLDPLSKELMTIARVAYKGLNTPEEVTIAYRAPDGAASLKVKIGEKEEVVALN